MTHVAHRDKAFRSKNEYFALYQDEGILVPPPKTIGITPFPGGGCGAPKLGSFRRHILEIVQLLFLSNCIKLLDYVGQNCRLPLRRDGGQPKTVKTRGNKRTESREQNAAKTLSPCLQCHCLQSYHFYTSVTSLTSIHIPSPLRNTAGIHKETSFDIVFGGTEDGNVRYGSH